MTEELKPCPCVCPTVRPIAIWLNDFLRNDERAMLLPFIERAMGSATTDRVEMQRRARLAVEFARSAAPYAPHAAFAYATAHAFAGDTELRKLLAKCDAAIKKARGEE